MSDESVLPFHEWKTRLRKAEAPIVRPREWYYAAYGMYVGNAKTRSRFWRDQNRDGSERPSGWPGEETQ